MKQTTANQETEESISWIVETVSTESIQLPLRRSSKPHSCFVSRVSSVLHNSQGSPQLTRSPGSSINPRVGNGTVIRPDNKQLQWGHETDRVTMKPIIYQPKPGKNKQVPLVAEGTYSAVVSKVTAKNKEGTEEQVGVTIEFTLDQSHLVIQRDYELDIQPRSPLSRHSKVIRGHGLLQKEALEGFDPSVLVGGRCQVTVIHQAGKGGMVAYPRLVLAAVTPVVAPAVAEPVAMAAS